MAQFCDGIETGLDSGRMLSFREHLDALSRALSSRDDSGAATTKSTLKNVLDELNQLIVKDVLIREMHQRAVASCQKAVLGLESEKKGRFEWCDSTIVKALLEGSWLLIDNANLCRLVILLIFRNEIAPSVNKPYSFDSLETCWI